MSARRSSFANIIRCAFGAVLLFAAAALGAQERFDELRVRGTVYTNVVVTGQTARDLFIRHSGGFATLKVSDLDPSTLERLGIAAPPQSSPSKASPSKASSSKPARASKTEEAGSQKEQKETSSDQQTRSKLKMWFVALTAGALGWSIFVVSLVGVPLGYVFFSRSCWQICRRAGFPSHVLVWLPIVKRLPLFKAAGVSWLWFFLGFIIPFIGFCAWILCCLRLCENFRCTRWWALLMIWPFIGWPVFMYLAWTSRADDLEPALTYRAAA